MTDLRDTALATRRRVLGDAWADRAEAPVAAAEEPFRDLVADAAWGRLWSRDAIPARERSMLTIALLAAQGCEAELALHVRATARTGASRGDVVEALMHVAVYAGVPRANHAMRVARDVWARMDEEGA